MTDAIISSEAAGRVDSARQRPTRVRYGVLAFLCVLAFLSYFDRNCITRAQEDIQRDVHISVQQMGAILSIFWLAYALFEIPGGWMGDRFGSRKTLTRIVLAWSLFTALTGSALGFVSLYTYRFLFGAGEAGAYPNMARVQSRWMPVAAQGRISGAIWMISRWGGAFSALLFGAMLRKVGSPAFRRVLDQMGLHTVSHLPAWRLAFWMCGLLGLVWVLLFYPWFRDNPADHPSVNAAELELITAGRSDAGKHEKPHYTRQIWRRLFTSRDLWALALYQALGSFGWSFFVSWLPKFFKAVHGLDYSKSELHSALPMFCGGIACIGGGWISDAIIRASGNRRVGRALLPMTGRLLCAASIFAVRYAHTPWAAVALMCFTMTAYDIGLGANWAGIIEVGGRYSGGAAGFVNMVGNLGNIAQPIVGAFIFTRWGWNALFAVYALFYLLSAMMWLIIDPCRTFYRDADLCIPDQSGAC